MMSKAIGVYMMGSRREELRRFAQEHQNLLKRFRFLVPEDCADVLRDGFDVECLTDSRKGGLIELAARICRGEVAAVFIAFTPDETPQLIEDQWVLLRLCSQWEVPFATNFSTARILVEHLRRRRVGWLIFNPAAGAGRAEADLAEIQHFLEPAMELVVRETTEEQDAEALTREAIDARANCVLAAGGDGTVSAVATALLGTDIPLGIIPRGTANALAACLFGTQITLSPIQAACETIITGKTRTIDTATANGRPMLLLAGAGFEAGMVERATRDLKNRFGALAYLFGGWEQLEEQEPFSARIVVDGTVQELTTSTVVVANAAPPTSVLAQGKGQPLLDDGLLDVTVVTNVKTTYEAIQTMVRLFNAGLFGTDAGTNVLHFRGKKIRLETSPAERVVVDGEAVGNTPVEFECRPASLKVFTGVG